MKFKELKELYPLAFAQDETSRYYNPNREAESFFECAEGWANLLEPVLAYMHKFNSENPESRIYISQIKEKFGTLRFYTSSANDTLGELINMAEDRSGRTCEVCGDAGKTRPGRWIRTTCDKHVQGK